MPHRYAIQVKKGKHEKPRHLARRALRAVMLALVNQALGTRQAGGVEVGRRSAVRAKGESCLKRIGSHQSVWLLCRFHACWLSLSNASCRKDRSLYQQSCDA